MLRLENVPTEKEMLRALNRGDVDLFPLKLPGGIIIALMHYAMRVWDRSHHGSWHLYGHSHGSLPPLVGKFSFDAGVDCWNFTPVALDTVKSEMESRGWRYGKSAV